MTRNLRKVNNSSDIFVLPVCKIEFYVWLSPPEYLVSSPPRLLCWLFKRGNESFPTREIDAKGRKGDCAVAVARWLRSSPWEAKSTVKCGWYWSWDCVHETWLNHALFVKLGILIFLHFLKITFKSISGKSKCAEKCPYPRGRKSIVSHRKSEGSHALQSKFARDTIWIVVGALTFHFLKNWSKSSKGFRQPNGKRWIILGAKNPRLVNPRRGTSLNKVWIAARKAPVSAATKWISWIRAEHHQSCWTREMLSILLIRARGMCS